MMITQPWKIFTGTAFVLLMIAGAQVCSGQAWLPGYFVNYNGDTTEATILTRPHAEGMGFDIKYRNSKGYIFLISPKFTKEVHYTENKKPVKLLAVKNSLDFASAGFQSEKVVFVKVILEGPLSLYEYYSEIYSIGVNKKYPYRVIKGNRLFMLKRGKENLHLITTGEDLSNFLSECPRAGELVPGKKLRPPVIVRIVQTYNQNCVR